MWWRRSRSHRRREPDDFAEEVRAHIEIEAAQLRDEGLSPDDARRRARRAFGNPTLQIERTYEASRWRWLDTLRQDVVYSLRLMRRSPRFAVTALLVLGVGVGVNTALFSIVNAVFFRPLPVHDLQSLRFVRAHSLDETIGVAVSADTVDAIKARTELFSMVTPAGTSSPRKVRVGGRTSFRTGETVAAAYFDIVDTSPVLGRVLLPEDEQPDALPVVLISERVWRSQFDGDPGVLGAPFEFDLSGVGGYFGPWRMHRIVGVLPAGFRGLGDAWSPTDFWVPSRPYPGATTRGTGEPERRPGTLSLLVRLHPGVTDAQVEAALEAIAYSLQRDPTAPSWKFSASTSRRHRLPFSSRVVPEYLAAGLLLVSGLVLLIATTNLAGVLGARAAGRGTEVAVRLALGAGRARVVRQLLTESAVMAVASGLLAVAVAQVLVSVFLASTPTTLGFAEISLDVPLDWRVFGFTALLCLGSGISAGLLPAQRATRWNLLRHFAAGTTTESASSRRGRRDWIVIPQIGGSLVLLVVAGTLIQTLLRAQAHDPGFEPEQVVMVGVEAPSELVRAANRQGALLELERRILERALRIPGVESASVVESFGLLGGLPLSLFHGWVVGRDTFDEASHRWVAQGSVTHDFFDTLRIPLRAGRLFDERDRPDSPPVAIVSESASRLLWADEPAVGRYVAFHDPDSTREPEWLEVVGVVGDAASPENDGWNPAVYRVRGQNPIIAGGGVLLVRGASPAGDLLRNVRQVAEATDATVQLMNARSLTDALDAVLYPRRMAAGILSAAGALALLLAAIGVYGVVSYSVALRVREMGIRAALGADRADIVWLVLRDGVRVLLLGTVTGGALTYAAVRTAAALVLPLPALDGTTLMVVPAVFAVVILTACAVPAWRASRVDPNVALRQL